VNGLRFERGLHVDSNLRSGHAQQRSVSNLRSHPSIYPREPWHGHVAEVACRSLPQGAHQGRIARAIASAIDPSVNARLVGCVCDGFFALLDPGGHHNLSQDTSPWSASTASVRFGSWRSRFKSLFLGGGRRSKYSFSSAGRESELLAEASKTT
jgi:hypothetical protein